MPAWSESAYAFAACDAFAAVSAQLPALAAAFLASLNMPMGSSSGWADSVPTAWPGGHEYPVLNPGLVTTRRPVRGWRTVFSAVETGASWRDRALDRSLETARARSAQRLERLIDAARELANETGSAGFTV